MDVRDKIMSLTSEIFIIDNTSESRSEFIERGFGDSNVILTSQHLQALLDGKCIAVSNGEYTTIISLQQDEI